MCEAGTGVEKSIGSLDMPGEDDEAMGFPACCPNDVVVPMNCGGRSSQASLKLSPSPNEGMLYWSAVRSWKKELRNLESVSVRRGAPDGGSGGGSIGGSGFGSTESAEGLIMSVSCSHAARNRLWLHAHHGLWIRQEEKQRSNSQPKRRYGSSVGDLSEAILGAVCTASMGASSRIRS